jgi:hypothetical protein
MAALFASRSPSLSHTAPKLTWGLSAGTMNMLTPVRTGSAGLVRAKAMMESARLLFEM